jgi:F-type H+-transporting ATPase subunit epsilon
MAGNIQLEIVTPEKIVVSEAAQTVASPGTLGEFGVLIGHTPFMTTLKTGPVRYTDADGQRLAEDRGREDIDFTRAKAALERAMQRIKLAKLSGN